MLHFKEYLLAVVSHWWALTGGLVVACITWAFTFMEMDVTSGLLGIIFLFVGLAVAQFMAWNDMRLKKEEAETALQAHLDEYNHALLLENIHHKNLHEPNANGSITDKKGNLTKRTQRTIELKLKNTINKPLAYRVKNFVIDGIDQMPGLLNTGGVLSAGTPESFYSNQIAAPPITPVETIIISVEISYGKPDTTLERVLRKKAVMTQDNNANRSTIVWLDLDKELLINVPR